MDVGKCWRLFIAVLAIATLSGTQTEAKGRVALVIGNNAYPNLQANQQLANAVSDARAMRETLKSLGFEVIYGENLNRRGMVDLLFDLTSRLSQGDTALIFYAGHGVSFSGANYLLPVDIPSPRASGRAEEGRLADQAISETQIIERVTSSGAAVTVLVLDACRDNPLQSSDRRSIGSTRGLAQGNPVRGVFSIYSAGHGQAALDRLGPDDRNPNSVFTRVFLEKLKTPGLSLQSVALQTRSAVVDLTRQVGHDQFPSYYDQIIGGEIYLAGLPSAAPSQRATSQATPQVRPDGDAAARSDYLLADKANSRAAWEAYLQRYPSGYYAELARTQRDKLAALEPRPSSSRPDFGAKVEIDKPAGPATLSRAALYEEDTTAQGRSFEGTARWFTESVTDRSQIQLSLRAEIEIPEKNISVSLTIRRNTDPSLPATHLVEVRFKLPESSHFAVEDLPGLMMKEAEASRGRPLEGLSVKVDKDYFLIGLSANDAGKTQNIPLLKERGWLDIPFAYSNKTRAILALEKGPAGERAFIQAFASWNE